MAGGDRHDRWVRRVLAAHGQPGGVRRVLATTIAIVAVAGLLIALAVGLGTVLPSWAVLPGLVVAVAVVFVGGMVLVLWING